MLSLWCIILCLSGINNQPCICVGFALYTLAAGWGLSLKIIIWTFSWKLSRAVVSRGFSQNIGRMLKAKVRENREEFEEVRRHKAQKNMFKISHVLSFRVSLLFKVFMLSLSPISCPSNWGWRNLKYSKVFQWREEQNKRLSDKFPETRWLFC